MYLTLPWQRQMSWKSGQKSTSLTQFGICMLLDAGTVKSKQLRSSDNISIYLMSSFSYNLIQKYMTYILHIYGKPCKNIQRHYTPKHPPIVVNAFISEKEREWHFYARALTDLSNRFYTVQKLVYTSSIQYRSISVFISRFIWTIVAVVG